MDTSTPDLSTTSLTQSIFLFSVPHLAVLGRSCGVRDQIKSGPTACKACSQPTVFSLPFFKKKKEILPTHCAIIYYSGPAPILYFLLDPQKFIFNSIQKLRNGILVFTSRKLQPSRDNELTVTVGKTSSSYQSTPKPLESYQFQFFRQSC